jgi:hypothetical protein
MNNGPSMDKKHQWRAILTTLGLLVAFCVLLPAAMGVVAAWNNTVSDLDGRCWTLRERTDLKVIDPTDATLDGDLVQTTNNQSNIINITTQTITFGNSSNDGYHSYDPVDAPDHAGAGDDMHLIMALNYSSHQLYLNDSTQFITKVRGLTETTDIKVYVWVQPWNYNKTAEIMWTETDAEVIASNTTEHIESDAIDGEWTTITCNFTQYDILKAEADLVDPTGNYLIIEYVIDNQTMTAGDFDGTFLDIQAWFSCPQGMGYISGVYMIEFVTGGIGALMFVCGLMATPWINLSQSGGSAPSIRGKIRQHTDQKRKTAHRGGQNNRR